VTVRPRGKGFEVYVRRGSRRYRRTLPSLTEAQLLEAQWKMALLKGQTPQMPESGSMESTISHYLDRTIRLHWEGTRGEKTAVSNAKDVIEYFGPSFDMTTLTTKHVNDLIEHFKERGLANASVNRKLAALGKLVAVAEEDGVITSRPKIPRMKEKNQRLKAFTHKEIDEMVSYMRSNDQNDVAALCLFLLDTGMRVSEARGLQWANVTEYHATLLDTKNGETRSVPLTKRAKALLDERRDCQAPWSDISQSRLTYVWNAARKFYGYDSDPDFVPHSLRHTCASRLAMSGTDIQAIQKWLGHKTLAMTMRYSHLTKQHLVSAKDNLEHWNETTAE